MRILMVSQFYPPPVGGQERHVRDLARGLMRRGHEVEVATIALGPAPAEPDDGVVVHRLVTTAQRLPGIYQDRGRPHALPVPDPALRAGLARLLGAQRFDVAHAHDWAVTSLLGPARAASVPVVWTQHDYSHLCATKRMMRGERIVCPGPALGACLRCAAQKHGPVVGPALVLSNTVGREMRRRGVAAFVPVSDAVRRRTRVPEARSTVIPNFVPDDRVGEAPAPMPDHADAAVLFVGDLLPDKGVGVLFEAYRHLTAPPPLELVGRRYPETPGDLAPGAKLVGVLEPDQVAAAMVAARVVVVPSITPDASPTVVLEAMATGRPVVASATGGIVDLVEDGRTGLLVAPGDPAALARALTMLLADPGRAAAMGRQGWERVHGFTASAVADRLEALYREVVSAPR